MTPIDHFLLRKFIQQAGDTLTGDWVLIGATLLPLLGISQRTTTDIDLIGMTPDQNQQTLDLMMIAEQLGMPIESINQAAAYFLFKIPNFKDHLVLLHRGKTSTLYRPDLYLFLALKINRLSETDLDDCLKFIVFTKAEKKSMGQDSIKKLLTDAIRNAESKTKKTRLKKLLEALF